MPTTVITGGTGGLGMAVAERLLRSSPDRHVALVDLAMRDTSQVEGLDPARVKAFACDVTDPGSVATTAAQIADAMPGLDTLVNAAGIVSRHDTLDLPIEAFRQMMAVHVDGTLLWSQALVRALGGSPGAIVNIGSVAGQFAIPRRAAYAAAKAAIHSLTKTMAVEWVPLGVRVNAVAPGYIETAMVADLSRLGVIDHDDIAGRHAMKRLATPDEIAAVVEFLLSSAASFVTGSVVFADGGFSAYKVD